MIRRRSFRIRSGSTHTPASLQKPRVSCYSPRSGKNCKSLPSLQERLNGRARREYVRLLRGMQGGQCWLVTLTRGRGLDLLLREEAWHPLLTRLRQRWPECQAWTVYEWGDRRGVHLHVVIKETSGLTEEWLQHVVGLLQNGTKVCVQPVTDPTGIARYLTKQLPNKRIMTGWPKHFRPVTTTRGWCAEWLSPKEWRSRRDAWQLERKR